MEENKNKINANQAYDNLLELEVFEEFTDLPEFSFEGNEKVVKSNPDIHVTFKPAGHYVIYKTRYKLLPETHPDHYTYIIYDKDELENNNRKVYKIFRPDMQEMTLGEATYDIGILFSGGRVFSDNHFIRKHYADN